MHSEGAYVAVGEGLGRGLGVVLGQLHGSQLPDGVRVKNTGQVPRQLLPRIGQLTPGTISWLAVHDQARNLELHAFQMPFSLASLHRSRLGCFWSFASLDLGPGIKYQWRTRQVYWDGNEGGGGTFLMNAAGASRSAAMLVSVKGSMESNPSSSALIARTAACVGWTRSRTSSGV